MKIFLLLILFLGCNSPQEEDACAYSPGCREAVHQEDLEIARQERAAEEKECNDREYHVWTSDDWVPRCREMNDEEKEEKCKENNGSWEPIGMEVHWDLSVDYNWDHHCVFQESVQ